MVEKAFKTCIHYSKNCRSSVLKIQFVKIFFSKASNRTSHLSLRSKLVLKFRKLDRPLRQQFSHTFGKLHPTFSHLFFRTNDKLLHIPSGSVLELEEFLLEVFQLSKLFIIYPLPQKNATLSCTRLKSFPRLFLPVGKLAFAAAELAKFLGNG